MSSRPAKAVPVEKVDHHKWEHLGPYGYHTTLDWCSRCGALGERYWVRGPRDKESHEVVEIRRATASTLCKTAAQKKKEREWQDELGHSNFRG